MNKRIRTRLILLAFSFVLIILGTQKTANPMEILFDEHESYQEMIILDDDYCKKYPGKK